MSRSKRLLRRLSSLFLWHRHLGLLIAPFVVLMAATGIMLNHTSELELDRQPVSGSTLLDWYGIDTPIYQNAYQLDVHWLSSWPGGLYLDQQPLDLEGRLLGAQHSGALIYLLLEGELILLTTRGDLVERLNSAGGLPVAPRRLGHTAQGRIAVEGEHGTFTADEMLIEWRPTTGDSVNWSEPHTPPASLTEALSRQVRSRRLDWERVVLDLHSGRLLGSWGPWFYDLIALIFIFTALSGVMLRWVRWRQQRRRVEHS